MIKPVVLLLAVALIVAPVCRSFSPGIGSKNQLPTIGVQSVRSNESMLWAKKRRRRKNPPTAPSTSEPTPAKPVPVPQETLEVENMTDDLEEGEEEVNMSDIVDVANFQFDGEILQPGRLQ